MALSLRARTRATRNLLIAATLAACGCHASAAMYQGRVEVGGLRFDAVDLAPDDGISPPSPVLDGDNSFAGFLGTEVRRHGRVEGLSHAPALSAFEQQMELLDGSTTAAATGDGFRTTGWGNDLYSNFNSTAFAIVGLKLAPHSGLAVSGRVTLSIACAQPATFDCGPRWPSYGGASNWMTLHSEGMFFEDWSTSLTTLYLADRPAGYTGTELSDAPFVLRLDNDGDSWQQATFTVSQQLTLGNIDPVPEPASVALCIAGLAALALRLRR
jgi:hypothetical protein